MLCSKPFLGLISYYAMSKLFFTDVQVRLNSSVQCLSNAISCHPALFSVTYLLLYSMVWQVVVPKIFLVLHASRNLPLSQEVESIFHPFKAGWDFVTSLWREWGRDASSCVTAGCKRDKIFASAAFSLLGCSPLEARRFTGKKLRRNVERHRVRDSGGSTCRRSQQTARLRSRQPELHQQTFENAYIPAPSPGQPR